MIHPCQGGKSRWRRFDVGNRRRGVGAGACWHVAGVVGIISASIFGYTDPKNLLYAEKLGLALQLTNIIRDVGEDARIGRIYLPVNELQQFKVTAADLLNGRYSENFKQLMRFQAQRAQAAYDEAFALQPSDYCACAGLI